MATEFWLRNPQRSVRQAIAEGVERYVFDQALVNWQRQSPHAFMREHFLGTGLNPLYVLQGDQGARLYSMFTTPDQPIAVWPTWDPSQELDLLEHYLALPQGEDIYLCGDDEIDSSIRPVFDQEHRVFITGGLRMQTGPQKDKIIGEIRQLCAGYPNAIVHLSGALTFGTMFNWGWQSVDWCTDEARVYGNIILPNGIKLRFASDDLMLYSDWIEMVGFTVERLSRHRNEQVQFHIRSALWAAENFDRDLRTKRRYTPNLAGASALPSTWASQNTNAQRNWRKSSTIASRALPMLNKADGDKAFCDYCVLSTSCKLARAEQVCGLEETEMGELAKHFKTRNSDQIIDGLTDLIVMQADRMERSVAAEDVEGEDGPSSEVTRQMNSVFSNATALAKLLNPNLNGKGTTVNNQTLNINGGNIPFSSGNPREVMAAIVKELTMAGIPRDEITADMIKAVLRQGSDQQTDQQALEGVIVQNTSAKE
jgi:hypothetical protein